MGSLSTGSLDNLYITVRLQRPCKATMVAWPLLLLARAINRWVGVRRSGAPHSGAHTKTPPRKTHAFTRGARRRRPEVCSGPATPAGKDPRSRTKRPMRARSSRVTAQPRGTHARTRKPGPKRPTQRRTAQICVRTCCVRLPTPPPLHAASRPSRRGTFRRDRV